MHEQRDGIRRGALRLLTGAALALTAPAYGATRGFTITSFDAIRVEAPVTVIVTTGTGASARAEGDQGALDRLQVDMSGRMLKVTMDRARSGEQSAGAATLRLSTGDLGKIVLSGGGSIAVSRMRGQHADIVLGGNGDVRVGEVALDDLSLIVAGAGRATLAGKVGVATIRVNGPGALAGEGLQVRQASIFNDGPGNVALIADVTAKVASSGSGDVTVAGKAACTVDNRGTGHVSCGGEDY